MEEYVNNQHLNLCDTPQHTSGKVKFPFSSVPYSFFQFAGVSTLGIDSCGFFLLMDIELNSIYEVRSNILQPNLLEGAGKSQGNSFTMIQHNLYHRFQEPSMPILRAISN